MANSKAKYNVLVLGSGGREHAIIKKLKHSKILGNLHTSCSNPLWHEDAAFVNLGNTEREFTSLAYECKKNEVDLVVVGPEKYLADGINEKLAQEGIQIFGPNKVASRLECFKSFTKELCSAHNIPCPDYWHFVRQENAMKFLEKHTSYPIVVKADGLAAGKGVTICHDPKSAVTAVQNVFSKKVDGQGKSVVIEEFLDGRELSFFAFVDGTNIVPMCSACDSKSVIIDGRSFNTGGMASYSPLVGIDPEIEYTIMRDIIYPTINALYSMSIEYKGVLFAGIMVHKDQPKLLEYNVRFGDPEIQCILPRLESDLLEILVQTVEGHLNSEVIELSKKSSVCLVMASKGYPIEEPLQSEIRGLEKLASIPNIQLLHAGTTVENGKIMSNGGRVLNIVATGSSLEDAGYQAYKAASCIDWPQGFYLKDAFNMDPVV